MKPSSILIEDYDYPLPDNRIASHPLAERDKCKLLVRRTDGDVSTHVFDTLPSLLPEGAMLVYNNTRVINARLRFHKGDDNTGALIEIFCLDPVEPRDYAVSFASTEKCRWSCFVGNSKRWKQGALTMPLTVGNESLTLSATRVERIGNASVVEFSWDNPAVTFSQIIEVAGEIPIPPYLNRATENSDLADYQTVFNRIEGSVAAPTAGLHFTPAVLEALDRAGIARREVTLHVGAGTFQPVKSETIGEHEMHSEFISVDRGLIAELASTDRPIIAVGTTSVRTLESLYHLGCMISERLEPDELDQWYPYKEDHPQLSLSESMNAILGRLDRLGLDRLVATTRLMIAPGYTYRVVSGMVTNFHQPKSTLLLLVSAMIGDDWRRVYDYALDNDYRFLSYGDACLFLKP